MALAGETFAAVTVVSACSIVEEVYVYCESVPSVVRLVYVFGSW